MAKPTKAEVTVMVDGVVAAELATLKRDLAAARRLVEAKDKEIADLQAEVDSWDDMRDALAAVFTVGKYQLGFDDGNERC